MTSKPQHQMHSSLSSRLTPLALVLGNLLPVVGILAWGWDVASVVIFYWTENLIIGFYNILKMLSRAPTEGKGKSAFMALFFTVHYGGFCAAHGFFVVELFDIQTANPAVGTAGHAAAIPFLGLLGEIVSFILAIAPNYWLWGFAALAVSHGFSWLNHWWVQGERLNQGLDKLMAQPYKRIITMHVVIIFGGMGIQALGSPWPLLLLLISLKVIADITAHLREHQRSWHDLLSWTTQPQLEQRH